MNNKIIIFGTGEIAELAFYYFTNDSIYNVIAFCCDDKYKQADELLGIPVIKSSEILENFPPQKYKMHIALSYSKLNQVREEKYCEFKGKGYDLVSYICSKSVFWDDLSIGDNCFILENQTIQPTVKIGNNVMIWSGNHLGHACEIDDHTYLSSHICISGHTKIGKRCFIGVNSTFKDFISVGDDVFIAMGAMVTKDISSNSTVVGAQSTIILPEEPLNIKLKKKYFNL